MMYPVLFVERRDRLGSDVLPSAGVYQLRRKAPINGFDDRGHHFTALIFLSDDLVCFPLAVEMHCAACPLLRRPLHGAVFEDVALGVSVLVTAKPDNNNTSLVASFLVTRGRVNSNDHSFQIFRYVRDAVQVDTTPLPQGTGDVIKDFRFEFLPP